MSHTVMVNDGVPAFLVALVLVLMLMLVAVIRLPRRTETQSSEDDQPGSEPAAGQLVSSWSAPDSSGPDWPASGRPQAAGLAADASASAPGRPRGAHAKHAHVRPAPPGVRQPSDQTAAAPADGSGPSVPSALAASRAQPREAGYAVRSGARPARLGAGAVPWRGTVRAPEVSGNPPWEPAPKPPGPATSLRDP